MCVYGLSPITRIYSQQVKLQKSWFYMLLCDTEVACCQSGPRLPQCHSHHVPREYMNTPASPRNSRTKQHQPSISNHVMMRWLLVAPGVPCRNHWNLFLLRFETQCHSSCWNLGKHFMSSSVSEPQIVTQGHKPCEKCSNILQYSSCWRG